MFLTDGRRVRHDLGPGNSLGQNTVRIANVEYGAHHAYFLAPLRPDCPFCGGPMPMGRLACSLACSQARYDRGGV